MMSQFLTVGLFACRRRKGVRDVVIMRASQLDAARLDNELTSMLREQFMRIFSLFQPVHQLFMLLQFE